MQDDDEITADLKTDEQNVEPDMEVAEPVDEIVDETTAEDVVVEDAEIVDEDDVMDPDQAPGAVTRILDLERTIKTYYQGMQAKREELKKNRDMVHDALASDKLYEEQQKQAEDFKRKQNQLRDQVMNIPSVLSAKEEIKGLTSEIKDMQKALSKFLLEYRRLSNSNHIQVTDDEFFEIVEDAKLVKATAQK